MKLIPIAAGCAALALSIPGAHATTNLATNGSFDTSSTTKTQLTNSNVAGWMTSNTSANSNHLTYIDPAGTADNGAYLSVYSGFPSTSPDGGSFIEADGDPSYSSFVYQQISGLTAGQSYLLTFFQAGSEQAGFTTSQNCPDGVNKCTTEYWKVFFGSTAPSSSYNAATLASADAAQTSSVQYTVQGSYSPWTQISMYFTATAATQYLTFLAQGTPNGAPPIAFLDGVNVAVPEPMTLSLMGAGILGLLGLRGRRGRSSANA